MEIFKSTENIKDINEIIKILKENCEISKRIRSEIKDMDCTTKNGVKREIINTDDKGLYYIYILIMVRLQTFSIKNVR